MTIKNFEDFEKSGNHLNEEFYGNEGLKKDLAKALPALLSGDVEYLKALAKNYGVGQTTTPGTTPGTSTSNSVVDSGESRIGTVSASDLKDEPSQKPSSTVSGISQVPGNDDFMLYMQHQQGIAGATGILRAFMGIGTMHPDTIKTKAGVKYANLIMNVPSDRPKVKSGIIKSLDAGDQKSAAYLFMTMWKEKWNYKQKEAQSLINQPKNQLVKNAITKYCNKYNVPFDFAITVATTESGLNPKVGNKRYRGLFALSKEEFTKYVPGGDIFNIEDNANAGVQCLKRNIREFIKYMGPSLTSNLKVSNWAKYA